MKIKYKKVPNNENTIEVDGKVVLSFDPTYKEYLKWKDENPELEQELLNEIGQEIENKRLYKLGAPHKSSDKWEWYNESGQLILESKISTNKENPTDSVWDVDGLYTSWYDNGQKESEGNILNGKKDGKWNVWYENGQITECTTYKKGKPVGKLDRWYPSGVKEREIIFDKKGLVTKQLWWYANGEQRTDGNYKDGKVDGLQTTWYENGKKEKEETYVDGHHKGKYINYYRNGKMRSEGQMLGGEMDGQWLFYFHNGKKEMECNFDFGVPVDIAKVYHDSGNFVREVDCD